MERADWIGLVEASYDLSLDDAAWARRVLETASPLFGDRLALALLLVRVSPTTFGVEQVEVLGPDEIRMQAAAANRDVPPPVVDILYRGGATLGSLGEQVFSRFPSLREPFVASSGGRVQDVRGVAGHTGNGWVAMFSAAQAGPAAPPTPLERRRWPRAAAHVAAGLRLRRLAASLAAEGPEVEAALDPGGKVHDAWGPAEPAPIRHLLRDAVRRVERARSAAGRRTPDEALAGWQGLVAGRWSLVDRFDSDGKRFVVALRNDPAHLDPRGLTPRERQVSEFVGLGRSTKEIAYTLGLSPSWRRACRPTRPQQNDHFGPTPPRGITRAEARGSMRALPRSAAARLARWLAPLASALARALPLALVALHAAAAGAAKIGSPILDLRIYGITQAENVSHLTGPGLHGPLLELVTESDLVNGGVVGQAQIGSSSNGAPVYAEVGIANDGDTFWAFADTPNHFQNADRDFIGSEALVVIYQSYTKDTEQASLTYTYTRAEVGAFFHVEYGPPCQPAEEYCLRAGMISLVEVYDAAGTALGGDANHGHVWSRIGSPPWEGAVQDGNTAWPWQIEQSGTGGADEYRAKLSEPVTNEVDLSGVAVGQEFTVVYTLWTYALDTSAGAGLFRGAEAFARDPLGGDTGVGFDLVDLTPTDNPSVRPAPEPAAALRLGFGIAALHSARRRRSASIPSRSRQGAG